VRNGKIPILLKTAAGVQSAQIEKGEKDGSFPPANVLYCIE
jgi:hypothetical protein